MQKASEQIHQIGNELSTGKPNPIYCVFCGIEQPFEAVDFLGKTKWIGPKECQCEGAERERELIRQHLEESREKTDAEKRIMRIEQLFQNSNLGERFKNRTFDNFKPRNNEQKTALKTALNYAENFKEIYKTGQGLFFNGKPGTGKTHLAAAICHYLINLTCPVLFGNVTSLLGRIKQTYERDSDESEAAIISQLNTVPLLIIDDLGKEYVKRDQFGWSWVHQKLYEVINSRYEGNMPLIVTTNLTLKELEQRTDEAIVSRIVEMCQGVNCDWEDYRKIMAVERNKGA